MASLLRYSRLLAGGDNGKVVAVSTLPRRRGDTLKQAAGWAGQVASGSTFVARSCRAADVVERQLDLPDSSACLA
jgi:hypothetical protein